ncbi:eukaryotic translation initiation factor 3 subunit A [Triticum aestivum]|uniref:Eukaryotic translation initiation factor 3 subunit A n=1 Tax=Triticum aestivum TaxID=4565 RepID=I0JTW5_WHEAT|nr:eukaryotic translation initiation factor 3 subunit A-like [Triticum aestivum]CCG48017.1 eukaryotic translation initiation factor 3 subunit A, putative, expressed [Triticum aestivum]
MATFAKPENALKRAEELIHVGQKQAALQALHDLITSKRYRSWQKPLEKIMMKYVELCVDLRKGRFAKDGLIQYRIVCQQVNVSSLEEVIKHFMQLSNEKAEEARNQAQALEDALDVEDLEADKRPEDLMLSYVSGEKGKDRSDREFVTPWFKFLWETYRTVLEILRNNSKLEALYAMTAHKAFQFCKQYKRSTEFRRLCEIIRNHLANLNKYRDQRDRPDLTAPESCQLYLDTRVEQLKIATELSLWQEAFRSVEDIHGLMSLVKRTPKPSVLVVYYAKLTEIFWISESHLYHAYAWLKLFNLQKSYNKNLTQKDLQLLASSVLLAALSVAPYDHKYGASHLELENEKDRSLRMANLVNFSLDSKRENREMVSRATLLSELAAKGVISCASQEVKDLYNLMEHEFLPLDLASKVQPLLSKISTIGGKLSAASSVPEIRLSQYQSALEKLTALRVLQQASRIFQSMKIDMLSRMIPFFEFNVVEKIAVDAVKHNFVAMKVNHLAGAVHFGNMDIESDVLSSHLSVLADSLNKALSLIHPPVQKPSKPSENLTNLAGVVEKEHRRLLARKSIIEKRKEDHERQILEKEKIEETKRLTIQKKSADEERERLLKEQRLREQQRIRKEIEEKEAREAAKMIEDLTGRGKNKKKIHIEGDMTKQHAMEVVLNQQVKERQEMEKKLAKLAKTMDHLERAKRQEEAPLIEEAFQKRLEEEKILHEQEQLREIELSKQHHAGDLQEKNRLSRLLEHKNAFQERIVQRRESEFSSLRKEREERINQLLSSRKRERETVRKLMYFLNMEEQRIQREREEQEARKREEEERRKKEEAVRKLKLDAIAAKQLQRERELEEREKQRREALLRGAEPVRAADAPAAAAVAPPAREPAAAAPAAAAAATGAAPSKYVPKWKREGDSSSQRPTAAAEPDRWVRDDRPRPALRQDAPPVRDARPIRQEAPPARDARPFRQEAPPAARQEAPPAARQPDGAAPAASTERWRPGSRTSANSSSTSSSTGWRR